ncbi:MAG: MATE family efflux transporter [Sphingorhabdus sp.]
MNAPTQERDLTTGPVARTLFLFALPALGVNILQSINGSVNSIWVGRILGEEALAATANAGMIMFVMFSSLFGFSMAVTILVGQAKGRGDIGQLRRIVGGSIGLFTVGGLLISLAGWVFTPWLLTVLSTPAEAYDLAITYLRVIFISMPPAFAMILLSSALRGVGDATTPLWTTVLYVLLDIILNPVFIIGLGPIPAMGIAGSALATLVAGVISTGFLLQRIYAGDLSIRLRGAEMAYLKPARAITKPLIALGFPMGLSMIIMALSGLIMVGLVNREGVQMAAAFGIMNQLWSYIMMPAVAVGIAVSAMVAQNIGAGKWDRVNRIAWSGMGVNLVMTVALLAAITLAANPILELFFASGSAAIPLSIHMNYWVGWTYIVMGVSMVAVSVVRANGAVIMPLVFLVISVIFVRLGVGFGLYRQYGADAIWWAFGVSAVASMVMAMAYFLHGGWRKLKPMGMAEEA